MSALEILAAWCGASLALVAVWCAIVEVGRRVTARRARRAEVEAPHTLASARARGTIRTGTLKGLTITDNTIDGTDDDGARIDFDWPDAP